MAKITFVNGPTRIEVENGDATVVGDLLAELRDQGLLPDGNNTVLRNGAVAGADETLEDGDEIAVTKPAGQKGARKR